MEPRSLGLLIVIGGLVAIGAFSWFGRLPGDIRIESGNIRVYIPITTMVLLSVVLSLLAAIFRRFH